MCLHRKDNPQKAKKGAGAPRARSKGKPLWEVILFSGTTGASTALVHSRPVPCDQAPMKGLQGKERRAFFAWWFAFRQETHTFPNPAALHFWKTVTPCLFLGLFPQLLTSFRGEGEEPPEGAYNPSFCGGKNTVATNRLPVGRSLGRIGAWRRNYPFLDGGTCSRVSGNPSLRSGIAAWYSPWSWRLFAPHSYLMGNRPAPAARIRKIPPSNG